MKKYVVDVGTEKFKSIPYRGSYTTIKNGEVFTEDSPLVNIYSEYFIEQNKIVITEELPIENIVKEEKNTFDEFFETDINTNENNDVKIEIE